jgi:hypothetical protein
MLAHPSRTFCRTFCHSFCRIRYLLNFLSRFLSNFILYNFVLSISFCRTKCFRTKCCRTSCWCMQGLFSEQHNTAAVLMTKGALLFVWEVKALTPPTHTKKTINF